jgi:protein arginine N-methyltransferase 3
MSIHLQTSSDQLLDPESGSSDSQSDDDQEFGDWVSDSAENQSCKSLFDDQILPSVDAAIMHDKKSHGFDFNQLCSSLGGFLARVRYRSR